MIRRLFAAALVLAAPAAAAPPPKLLVISVDGLDWRYLRDRDAMGLKIPNLRRLMAEGETAQGVEGVVPTITWPSHTTLITGVRPDQHGVTSNVKRDAPVAESVWRTNVLKAQTLYQCAAGQGRTTSAITWPTTVEPDPAHGQITWNLPEYFLRRNGGDMDLEGVALYATPGLVAEIGQAYPSFGQQWVDDRTRTLASLYILKAKRPDLMLVHLVDLDSDQHDRGPFQPEAYATVERTDELIGDMLKAAAGYRVVITSDHGFERVDRVVNLPVRAAADGVTGEVKGQGGLVVTSDPKAADWLRALAADPKSGVGREVPAAELARLAPTLAGQTAFEPAPHVQFGRAATGPLESPPREKGDHGFWPGRADYGSVYLLWGQGVPHKTLPRISMLDIRDRLAAAMDLKCPAAG